MKNIFSIMSVVISFGLFGINNSFAIDSKIHPGNMCQPNYHSEAGDLRYSSTRVSTLNSAFGTTLVSCPVVRDNTTNLNGISVAYLRANVPAGNTMSCYFDSVNTNGSLNAWDQSTATAGNHSTSFNINASPSRGHYSLLCYMPPNTSIYNYRVDEY